MSKNSPVIEIYRVITQFRGLATQTPITHATTYPANYDSIILPKTKTLSGSTLGSIRNLSNSNLQQTALVAVYSLAASTPRLFSSSKSRNEGQFAEVGAMLAEAEPPKDSQAPEAAKPKEFARDDSRDLSNVPLLQGLRIARPRDFARPVQGSGYRKRPLLGPPAAESRRQDVFYQLGLDPLHECQNSQLMSWYVSGMGKIKSRAETGLTWKNQRRLGKAIRRAKMMGIIPVLSRRTLGLSSAKRDQW
ncbi:hypothetical protein NLI96_g2669 [Meripilus lineatus]|uniref:Small ribosomal subunit protein bS18m n=1 Tax=Meripilus lineatus TaxID=2056292 RepID=A0AAD5YGE2_9APHY|nr:hypothetical protein NLI96_g2669 [Physisporinus lineatus]